MFSSPASNLSKSLQVLWHFFWLGCVSFGGPAAHLGYFRQHFVERMKWLNDNDYGQLIALSQFLPGPGSSQVGFAIGYRYAGLLGAWAAFIGFTLPSFLLLLWVALYQPPSDQPIYALVISGLKLLAVVVVADAVLKMFRQFCQRIETRVVAVVSALLLLGFAGNLMQIAVLVLAFAIGWRFFACKQIVNSTTPPNINKPLLSWLFLGFIGALIAVYLLLPNQFISQYLWLNLFAPFAQAGSLVFGGGHVVLPLLQNSIGEQVSSEQFLTGYALAQAVPGPMFTIAAYLGAILMPQTPIIGAVIATLGVFLPGLLLILALLNSWQKWAHHPQLQGGIKLLNAAVVGLLLASLINPIASSAIVDLASALAALFGFILLRRYQLKIGWLLLIYALIWPCILWIWG
ncbi:chromate efflux transporter [Thiomicrorhabdus sp. 6S2-11]|uniref:Chromate efflux transporter n=1 Tax=Thiomicrorhabdus marina TaxID=2818442 RepID=A0ABS3Q6I1_9GAMM|nr:chromate efflux transporter [Thiomicrorhabdus marina]MBO1927942.1 chromate efflux transporter [Thiomicrorhabdus marina]